MVALLILDEEKDLDAVAATTLLQRNNPSIAVMAGGKEAPHRQMLVNHICAMEWPTLFRNARYPASLHIELMLNGYRQVREGPHLLKCMALPAGRLAGECIERHQAENGEGSKSDHGVPG
jgi:hypothetical protein